MTLIVGIVTQMGAVMSADSAVHDDSGKFVKSICKITSIDNRFVIGISGRESLHAVVKAIAGSEPTLQELKEDRRYRSRGGANVRVLYEAIRDTHQFNINEGNRPKLTSRQQQEILIIEPSGLVSRRAWKIVSRPERRTGVLVKKPGIEPIEDNCWHFVPYSQRTKELYETSGFTNRAVSNADKSLEELLDEAQNRIRLAIQNNDDLKPPIHSVVVHPDGTQEWHKE